MIYMQLIKNPFLQNYAGADFFGYALEIISSFGISEVINVIVLHILGFPNPCLI